MFVLLKDKKVKTDVVSIWIGGPVAEIERACAAFCETGLCVAVSPCNFIYTGGREVGAHVFLVNYPRFPQSKKQLVQKAIALAKYLRKAVYQDSVLVVAPDTTTWITRRKI